MANTASINYDKVKDYLELCGRMSTSIDELPKASKNDVLKTLETLKLSNGFPANFDSDIKKITSTMSLVTDSCTGFLEELKKQDEKAKESFTPPATTPVTKPPVVTVSTQPPTTPTTRAPIKVQEVVRPSYEKILNSPKTQPATQPPTQPPTAPTIPRINYITDDDYDIAVKLLYDMSKDSNVPMDQMLTTNNSGNIEKVMLGDVKLSKDFKSIVFDTNSSVEPVENLKNLISKRMDKFLEDKKMTETLVDYLKLYADENNTSYDQLLNDQSKIDVLRKGLEDFSKLGEVVEVVNKESIQQKLLDLYEGRANSNAPRSAVKAFVDNTCGNSYKDMLKNNQYSEQIYKATEGLNEATKAAGLLSSCSTSVIIDTLKHIGTSNSQMGLR